MNQMSNLLGLSLKSAMNSQDLERLEADAAQFIKSSFRIIDNMRQASNQGVSKFQQIHRECVTLALDEKLATLIASSKRHEERKVKEIVRKKSHLKQRTAFKAHVNGDMGAGIAQCEYSRKDWKYAHSGARGRLFIPNCSSSTCSSTT